MERKSNFVVQPYYSEVIEIIDDQESINEYNRILEELGIEKTEAQKDSKSPIPFMHMNTTTQEIFETLCPSRLSYDEYQSCVAPIPLEALKTIKLALDEKHFFKVEVWYDEKDLDPVAVGLIGGVYVSDWNSENKNFYREFFREDLNPGSAEEFTLLMTKEAIFPSKFHIVDRIKELISSMGHETLNGKDLERLKKLTIYDRVSDRFAICRWGDEAKDIDTLKAAAVKRFIGERKNRYQAEIDNAKAELSKLESEANRRFGVI